MRDEWPTISRSAADIGLLSPDPYASLDWEWDVGTGRPTILGISDGRRTVSVAHEEGRPYLRQLIERGGDHVKWIGHNFLGADLQVARRDGLRIEARNVVDTILLHWLTNMSLCKGAKKTEGDEVEKRGRGWMNLWAWCSLYTDAKNWKDCWGPECKERGNPCPDHNVYGYNGCDAYWPTQAIGPTLRRAKLMGVEGLLGMHQELVEVLERMKEKGLYVNREYVRELRGWFVGEGKRLREGMGYNPDSPKQVVEWFKARGVELRDAKQATIDEACEESEDEDLHKLQEYGRLGNGPDRWFADRYFDADSGRWTGYVDANGFIHCSLQPFTSSARLVCSDPNLQNVAHRPRKFERDPRNTLAMRIRRAIEAPEGMWLYEADYSNAENRVMLHRAGHPVGQDVDLHSWVAELAGFKPEDAFCQQEGSPRQAAKTVQHGNNYGEGLQLLSPAVARSSKIRSEVASGLRLLYPDWVVFGQVVSFTGINFARRAFGSASWENRRRANDILGRYFGKFSGLRELQRSISLQVEREGCVRNEFGYVLPSYGYEHDRLKIAWAFTGQNPVAHATKVAMLAFDGHPYIDLRLQVHDSLLFYCDRRYEPVKVAREIREVMEAPVGGLALPVEVKYGPNWADTQKIKEVVN